MMRKYFFLHTAYDGLQTIGGFAALFTVVVIAAVTLLVVQSSSFLGIGEVDMGFTGERGSRSFSVADGCVEETLQRLRTDVNYGVGIPPFNLLTPDGFCTIEVTANGSERIIFVTSTVDTFHKSLEVRGNASELNNSFMVTSWREQESF